MGNKVTHPTDLMTGGSHRGKAEVDGRYNGCMHSNTEYRTLFRILNTGYWLLNLNGRYKLIPPDQDEDTPPPEPHSRLQPFP